jgi:hypothetical protein
MRLQAATSRPLVNLGLGVAVLAVGLVTAHRTLPEWRLQRLPPRAVFVARYRALAGRLGIRLAPGEPGTTLSTTRRLDQICGAGRAFGVICSETRVTVAQVGTPEREALPHLLEIGFTPSGKVQGLIWAVPDTVIFSARTPSPHPPVELFASSLLRPGEVLGPPRQLLLGGFNLTVHPLAGSAPPQHLLSTDLPQQQGFLIGRLLGSAERTVPFSSRPSSFRACTSTGCPAPSPPPPFLWPAS